MLSFCTSGMCHDLVQDCKHDFICWLQNLCSLVACSISSNSPGFGLSKGYTEHAAITSDEKLDSRGAPTSYLQAQHSLLLGFSHEIPSGIKVQKIVSGWHSARRKSSLYVESVKVSSPARYQAMLFSGIYILTLSFWENWSIQLFIQLLSTFKFFGL